MTGATVAQARILESRQYYQNEVTRVIAPLTAELMRFRPVPGLPAPEL